MSHESIFELSHYSKFEIFNQIKRNCESERPGAVVEIKYGDLIRLAACSQHLARMLFEWDTQLYRSLDQYMIHKITSIYIEFEEVYKRLATASSREKETYWSSFSHAIREAGPKQVVLRYAPESYHSDHMEAFHTVMGHLQNKLNLKELSIYIPGYTLEGLGKLKSLETLSLNIRMDIDDLVESCKQNKNLKNLSYMNNETGGKRLATIAPHCGELEELTFKMRPDCDASEYKPLAKIPKLNHLKIAGVHERGTLQPLLEACVAKRRKLTRLSVDDVPLDKAETQALAQIETLTKVKCGFDDPQSIGLLSQLTKLGFLDILSKHDFLAISEQVLSILKDSIAEKWIDIVDINTNIWYQPSAGELILTIRGDNVNASDFGPLATLPGLCSLEISGSPQIGSLKPILNELVAAFRRAPTLTSLRLGKITAAEVAIVSQIASLKRLECGIAEKEQIPLPKEMTEPVPSSSGSAQKILASQNAELLAQLPLLEEITFISGPLSPVIPQRFLTALACKESQTLQNLCFLGWKANIDTVAAKELARLRSLRTLRCHFADPLDIQLLSHLTELEDLCLIANETFDKISPGLLTVIKSCKKLSRIDIYIQHNQTSCGPVNTTSPDICAILEASQDFIYIEINGRSVWFNREKEVIAFKKKELCVEMSLFENENFAMEPLARLESVQHLHILGNNKTVSFREFFAALGRRTNPELQSLVMTSPLDFDETMELAKITSLTSFNGSLSDARSFQHLLHLSDFDVKEIFIRHIEFNKSTGVLFIRIWKDAQGSDTDLNPLARLPNLRHVTIEGPFEEGSMHSFFGQLATWQAETLQELDAGYYKMSNNELREVCRMRSLRTLNCSLSCAKDLEQLAELPQLAELIVVTHEKGSLQNLLAKLAGRESHTLEHLDVRSAALTPEEVKAVSAISSLKRLTSAFCCTEGLDVLSKRSCIDELVITTGKDETSPIDLLTAFGSLGESKIQNLKIKGPAADQEPAKVLDIVSQIPKLKSLEIPIKDTQGTEGLAESLYLETLTISSTPERGTLEGLFGALSLKASSKLKNLDLGRSFVGLEEARHLVQVDSITSLVCGFKDEESLSLLANMTNLETIDITSTHVFDTISGHLLEIFRGCRKLEYISLGSTNCRMWESFLQNSVDILKSVRDLSVQAPLNIRISTSSQAFTNEMTANDKMYLTVTSKSM